jgi:hypothetical protein
LETNAEGEKIQIQVSQGTKENHRLFQALSWSNWLCDSIWISILCLESGCVLETIETLGRIDFT